MPDWRLSRNQARSGRRPQGDDNPVCLSRAQVRHRLRLWVAQSVRVGLVPPLAEAGPVFATGLGVGVQLTAEEARGVGLDAGGLPRLVLLWTGAVDGFAKRLQVDLSELFDEPAAVVYLAEGDKVYMQHASEHCFKSLGLICPESKSNG